LIDSGFLDSHNLNFSNRPVRTRMPGGVAGAQPEMAAPYADCQEINFDYLLLQICSSRASRPQPLR
jgi:hypothetical protein